MKEAELTITLLVDEKYSQDDVDEIVYDFKKIIGMTDSDEISWEDGSAKIIV